MQPYPEDQKAQALSAASAWWRARPSVSTDGEPVCIACGAVIAEREGTSLVGPDLRCAACTNRFFASAVPMTTAGATTVLQQALPGA